MNLSINIEEPVKGSKSSEIFFGNHSRIPSHTDIVFLSKTRLVIAHRFAGKLYLVQLQGNKFHILHTINIHYKGLRDYPDLICTDNQFIYIINFNNLLHIVETKYDMLRHVKSVVLHPTFGYHGLCVSEKKLYLTSTTRVKDEDFIITEYDIESQAIRHLPILGNKNRLKDISFLNPTTCILLTSFNDRDVGLGKKKEIYDGEILLCSFDKTQFTVLDTISFTSSHLDSVCVKGNVLYCTSSFGDGSFFILTSEIVDKKLTNVQKHPCEPFPHGIDIYEDMIGYSCYGTSTTYIKQLSLLST